MTNSGYQPQEGEKHAKVGGILILIGSGLGFIMGIFFAEVGSALEGTGGLRTLCYLPLLFSLVGGLGGIMALRKENYFLSILGGIVGLFSIGFFIGSILCIVGVILVGLSKEDFKSSKPDSPSGYASQTLQNQVSSKAPPPRRNLSRIGESDRCSNCGTDYPDSANYCYHCGKKMGDGTVGLEDFSGPQCNCGVYNPEEANYCYACGGQIDEGTEVW